MRRRDFIASLLAAVAFRRKQAPQRIPAGISIRIIRTYDQRTNAMVSRWDVLDGIGFIDPSLRVIVLS